MLHSLTLFWICEFDTIHRMSIKSDPTSPFTSEREKVYNGAAALVS